jgi:hypothetical protein
VLIKLQDSKIVSGYKTQKFILTDWFLGTFAKLRKVTISFVMSVCPSVRMENPGSHWGGGGIS